MARPRRARPRRPRCNPTAPCCSRAPTSTGSAAMVERARQPRPRCRRPLSVRPETIDALLASADPATPSSSRAAGRHRPAARSWSLRPARPRCPGGRRAARRARTAAERGRAVLTHRWGWRPRRRQLAAPTLGAAGSRCSPTAGVTGWSSTTSTSSRSPTASSATRWPSRSWSRCPRTPRRRPHARPGPRRCHRTRRDGAARTPTAPPGCREPACSPSSRSSGSSSRAWRAAACSASPRACRATTVRSSLQAIGTGRPFEAVTLADAFEHAGAAARRRRQPGGASTRARRPPTRSPRTRPSASATGAADLDTFTALVGRTSPLPDLPEPHLLVATGAGPRRRRARAPTSTRRRPPWTTSPSGVTTPPTFTLTLTAARAPSRSPSATTPACPSTCRSACAARSSSSPTATRSSWSSSRRRTRIDIRVRSRATGAFPLAHRRPHARRPAQPVDEPLHGPVHRGVGRRPRAVDRRRRVPHRVVGPPLATAPAAARSSSPPTATRQRQPVDAGREARLRRAG